MEIAEVRESLLWLDHSKVNVQISIRLLCFFYHVDELEDRLLDLFVRLLAKKVASALDPFSNVTFPEEMIRNRPVIGLVIVGRMPLQLEGIVASRVLKDLQLVK